MVVGFPNVTRSSPDLESGVVSNVCRPPPLLRAPQTKESLDILGDTGDCWGIRESTRVVRQTIMYFLSTQDNGWNHVLMDINWMWVRIPHTGMPYTGMPYRMPRIIGAFP